MFSFRTTPIEDQLDRALLEGKVGVFCTPACWDAGKSAYLYDIFRRRGNLECIFLPGEESVPGTAHISFDIEEIKGLDALVVEIQDAGSRYFPFTIDVLRLISSMDSLENPPALYILDHPNPAGREVEGTLPAGDADIWTPAAAHRHGLTLGELAQMYVNDTGAKIALHVISAEVASTARTLLPWMIPPASDFAGVFTPYFYGGGKLWTDTNVNPGLGTVRPYEMIGAPFIKTDGNEVPVPDGVLARPCSFVPLSGMYEGQTCFGWQFILTPGAHYHSLLHTIRLMHFLSGRYSQFRIFDSLFGRLADPVMAEYLRGGITFDIVEEHVKGEEQKWIRKAKRFLLYDEQPVRIK